MWDGFRRRPASAAEFVASQPREAKRLKTRRSPGAREATWWSYVVHLVGVFLFPWKQGRELTFGKGKTFHDS